MTEEEIVNEESVTETIGAEISGNELSETQLSDTELSGTELEDFEAAEIEDLEAIELDRVVGIVESLLFASDRPISLTTLRQVFRGTTAKTPMIKEALAALARDLSAERRGVVLEEVGSGYQLRTKTEFQSYLRQTVKAKPFKLSGAALETLSIVAYQQPITKFQVDEIRGVESGHLIRGLMERGLVHFEGKSELPGKPMLYGTTRKFLEVFGLRNIKELPSLQEIEQLMPEGIGEIEDRKDTLEDLTTNLSEAVQETYSQAEDELMDITEKLSAIETATLQFNPEETKPKEHDV